MSGPSENRILQDLVDRMTLDRENADKEREQHRLEIAELHKMIKGKSQTVRRSVDDWGRNYTTETEDQLLRCNDKVC